MPDEARNRARIRNAVSSRWRFAPQPEIQEQRARNLGTTGMSRYIGFLNRVQDFHLRVDSETRLLDLMGWPARLQLPWNVDTFSTRGARHTLVVCALCASGWNNSFIFERPPLGWLASRPDMNRDTCPLCGATLYNPGTSYYPWFVLSPARCVASLEWRYLTSVQAADVLRAWDWRNRVPLQGAREDTFTKTVYSLLLPSHEVSRDQWIHFVNNINGIGFNLAVEPENYLQAWANERRSGTTKESHTEEREPYLDEFRKILVSEIERIVGAVQR